MSSSEFTKAFYEILERAVRLAKKSRDEGILSLEDDLNNKKADSRDILEYGLRFVIDGTEAAFIRTLLSNIINQEKDAEKLVLKNIQLAAVLSIQACDNHRMLACLLNSYTDIPLNDPEFKRISGWDA